MKIIIMNVSNFSHEIISNGFDSFFPKFWQPVESPTVEGENPDVGVVKARSPILVVGL